MRIGTIRAGTFAAPAARRRDTFEQIALPHLDLLYTFAFQMTGDQELAGSLVERVFVKAFGWWRQSHDDANVRLWMLKTLQSLMDEHHARQISAQPDGPVGKAAQELESSGERLPAWISEEAVGRGIRSLPKDSRAIIILCDVVKLTYSEIGDVLECTVDEVSSRLHMARRWLHANLLSEAVEQRVCSC